MMKLIWAPELIRGPWRNILLQSIYILTDNCKNKNKVFIFSIVNREIVIINKLVAWPNILNFANWVIFFPEINSANTYL